MWGAQFLDSQRCLEALQVSTLPDFWGTQSRVQLIFFRLMLTIMGHWSCITVLPCYILAPYFFNFCFPDLYINWRLYSCMHWIESYFAVLIPLLIYWSLRDRRCIKNASLAYSIYRLSVIVTLYCQKREKQLSHCRVTDWQWMCCVWLS